MEHDRSKVSLVSNLDEVLHELLPQTMWMVRPRYNRKYPNQHMKMTVEVVDLNTLNLAKMQTFEVL